MYCGMGTGIRSIYPSYLMQAHAGEESGRTVRTQPTYPCLVFPECFGSKPLLNRTKKRILYDGLNVSYPTADKRASMASKAL